MAVILSRPQFKHFLWNCPQVKCQMKVLMTIQHRSKWWLKLADLYQWVTPYYQATMNELTHWGWDKMAAVSQTTLSNAFSWMKMLEFGLRFHWSLFPRVQLTIFHHWFRWWLGADQATSHYLNQWWFIYWSIYASLGLNELISAKT